MAKYDNLTPKDILKAIEEKNKQGYFVQPLSDKKQKAQYHQAILDDYEGAKKIYKELRHDIKNKRLLRSPTGSSKDFAKFLQNTQDPDTGSFVEYPSIDWLEIARAKQILGNLKQAGLKPKYPLYFLNRYDTGKKLKDYFRSVLYDFSKNNEDDLNMLITSLPTIKSMGFHRFSKDWDDAFYECLDMWQDKKTGYWGPWFLDGRRIIKKPELSTTFHIIRLYIDKKTLKIKDKKHPLKLKKRIYETTWKLKNKNYPYGWLEKGRWSSHHNWDVAWIFLALFKDLSLDQKYDIRKLFKRFLSWGLSNMIDGGFIGYKPHKKRPGMLSTNFGVLLLRDVGYFREDIRDILWDPGKVNSYRIYRDEGPSHAFDTSNLVYVIYKKNSTLDPLDARRKIYQFWSANKHSDPSEAMNIDASLLFERYPVKEFKISYKRPRLKDNEMIVAVDRFGRILSDN